MSEVPLYHVYKFQPPGVQDSGLRVQGLGFRVEDLEFRVQRSGFRI